jgi:hypothetical protein
MTRNVLKSSEKSRNLEKLILALKSFINILNNRGPKMEPYGTPDNMEKREEDFPKVRLFCGRCLTTALHATIH